MLSVEHFAMLVKRDAALDAQAAMKAYQAGIAYAINFVVLYLALTLGVVALVSFMCYVASSKVRRSPIFVIIAVAASLCVAAAAINISQNKDLVVNPTDGVDRVRYTSLIAVSMFIPFLCDFTLILRILAFYPHRSCAWWKPYAAVAFPCLIKVPRFVFIVMYIQYCWKSTENAADMLTIIHRVNQVQYAVCDWGLMLADQLYCTSYLGYKLYKLGWGLGDEKHLSRPFLTAVRAIFYSALASFAIPSFFLMSLIAMQVLEYRPDILGYVFATTIHLCVACTVFACLWPAIRADRRQIRSNSLEKHVNSGSHNATCHNCGTISVDQNKRGHLSVARGSPHKSASCATSGEDLIDPTISPSPSYKEFGRTRSNTGSSAKKCPSYKRGDLEAVFELSHLPVLDGNGTHASNRHAGDKTLSSSPERGGGFAPIGEELFVIHSDQEDAISSSRVEEAKRESGTVDYFSTKALAAKNKLTAQGPKAPETQWIKKGHERNGSQTDINATPLNETRSSVPRQSLNMNADMVVIRGSDGNVEGSFPSEIPFQATDHPYASSLRKGGDHPESPASEVEVYVGGGRRTYGSRGSKLANAADLSGIKIVTTQESWTTS